MNRQLLDLYTDYRFSSFGATTATGCCAITRFGTWLRLKPCAIMRFGNAAEAGRTRKLYALVHKDSKKPG